MTTIYEFETTGAGSQNLTSTYINQLDSSDLCIFLVDNSDGIPDPVLAEHKRARILNKKSLYIFCDKNKKKPTELQKEIIKTQIGKFVVVHEFSDFIERAYIDTINDIVNIYKAYCCGQVDEKSNLSETNAIIKELNAYKLDKSLFKGFDLTRNELNHIILSYNREIKETSELDIMFKQFLLVLIGYDSSSSINFVKLNEQVCLVHNKDIKDFISSRIKIIELYFKNDLEKCFCEFQELYLKYNNDNVIPNWMLNDLLIDMRYIENVIDETRNKFSMLTKGQELLDNNNEYLYYPLLDRYCASLKEDTIKNYLHEYTDSPYTVNMGGIDNIFKTIADTFIVAVTYGSLIQILLVKERLIEALLSLCLIFHNNSWFIMLIKLLLLSQRDKDIQNIIRAYNQTTDMINESDIHEFISSIEFITIPHKKLISKLLVFKYYGYIISDEEYKLFTEDLLSEIERWIDDENRVNIISRYIFESLSNNIGRMNNEKILLLCLKIYQKGFRGFYDDIFNLISDIDFSEIQDSVNDRINEMFINIIDEKEAIGNYQNLKRALIYIKLNNNRNEVKLDAKIKENMNEFYRNDYSLNTMLCNKSSIKKHIRRYVDIINQRNKVQGKNGTYFGYSDNPYQVIQNIIEYKKYIVEKSDIESILSCIEDTLLLKTQTISAKINSIQLLIFLKNKCMINNELILTFEKLKHNEETVLTGNEDSMFNKDTINTLRFNFLILELCFKEDVTNDVLSVMASFAQVNEYEIIKSLQAIDVLLSTIDINEVDENIILIITQYAIGLCSHKEKDIRYLSVKILLKLTKTNVKSLALSELSKMMDNDIVSVKLAIISGIKSLKLKDEEITNYIYQKGRIDNNYLVRKISIT